MIRELQLRVLPQDAVSEQTLKQVVSQETGVSVGEINAVRILKRSIDARQRTIFVNLKVQVFIEEDPTAPAYQSVTYGDVSSGKPVVIVGAGPGGLFAALRAIELGLRPIVVERGKNVRERKKDIARISREHRVNPESNYSFGEGGAGAYSDGKLYTRSKKRGSVEKILNVFCQHGASTAILVDAHPHIGTDKLPRVISNIRRTILEAGGSFVFDARVTDVELHDDRVKGVWVGDTLYEGAAVVLATGHSARDIYELLHRRGVRLEAKPFAMGVRIEHPQALIDSIQYHCESRGEYLPAASYSLVSQEGGRGVYSFCMCPGGFIVPAMTDAAESVVNGMSPSGRNSVFANSGLVTEVRISSICGQSGASWPG